MEALPSSGRSRDDGGAPLQGVALGGGGVGREITGTAVCGRHALAMTAYHVTKATNLDSILKTGLMPQVPKDFADEKAVYLFPSTEAAWDSFDQWLGDRFEEEDELLLLTVDITGLQTRQIVEWELMVFETIEPRRILSHQPF